MIVPVVEGFGEERAVPILVRRWLRHRRFDRWFDVPDYAVNAKGAGKLRAAFDARRHIGIEHYVRAALHARPDAILVVLDADKACLDRGPDAALGPELLGRARAIAGEVPVSVVVANRTYEAWLLAGRTALLRCDLVRRNAPLRGLRDPETRAGSKAVMSDFIGRLYSPPVHQPELTQALSFSAGSQQRAPSLAKLTRELQRLAGARTCAARRRTATATASWRARSSGAWGSRRSPIRGRSSASATPFRSRTARLSFDSSRWCSRAIWPPRAAWQSSDAGPCGGPCPSETSSGASRSAAWISWTPALRGRGGASGAGVPWRITSAPTARKQTACGAWTRPNGCSSGPPPCSWTATASLRSSTTCAAGIAS
ncbi:MAG: DUF4276 family protein [Deltaproteobacteria bacterium]|nr:DUF4276 family protein [Deltaproteobacteria bacterium]